MWPASRPLQDLVQVRGIAAEVAEEAVQSFFGSGRLSDMSTLDEESFHDGDAVSAPRLIDELVQAAESRQRSMLALPKDKQM